MKKELFAAIVIISLLAGAGYNIFHIKTLSKSISNHLDSAIQACVVNDYNAAETELSDALNLWLEADGYTHIFIRHAEIDSATDAFFEAISELNAKSSSSISVISKAKYHIDSIYAMERITLKSVF